MRDWQSLAAAIADRYKPVPDSSVFHYDADIGAVLVNYIEESTPDELVAYNSEPITWRVVSAAGPLYLCHAIRGRSWNETPINLFSDEQAWKRFLDLTSSEVKLSYVLLDSTDGRLLVVRECCLDSTSTAELKTGLYRQQELGLDGLIAAEQLGDPSEFAHKLVASPELPEIVGVEVDHERKVAKILSKSRVVQEAGEPRPRWMLRMVSAMPRTDFKYYENVVARYNAQHKPPPWSHCFYPISALRDREEERQDQQLRDELLGLGIRGHEAEAHIARANESVASEYPWVYMGLLLAWRQGQGIYRFDPENAAETMVNSAAYAL